MYDLYYKKHETEQAWIEDPFLSSCRIEVHRITVFRHGIKGETLRLTDRLMRVYFGIITGWRAQVYGLFDGNVCVHTSLVVPSCYKFPFLGSFDFAIGPCFTAKPYRRKGCYRYVLEHITADRMHPDATYYMIVSNTNTASVKGIEKAGFERCGCVKKSRFLKVYQRSDNHA